MLKQKGKEANKTKILKNTITSKRKDYVVLVKNERLIGIDLHDEKQKLNAEIVELRKVYEKKIGLQKARD